MKSIRFLLAASLAFFLPSVYLVAQNDDFSALLSVGIDKKIASGLSAEFEAEYPIRQDQKQWSLSGNLSYRLYRNKAKTFDIKADAGLKFSRIYKPEEKIMKDSVFSWDENLGQDVFRGQTFNVNDSYDYSRFKAFASVSLSYELGRFKFALRERYQFTWNDSVSIVSHRWRYDKSSGQISERPDKAETKWKATDNRRHVLRSRLQIGYDIPKCKVDPYASAELFNDLKNGFCIQKTRFTAGVECKIRKVHVLKLYYYYQHEPDDEEPGGHVAGLSYCYNF